MNSIFLSGRLTKDPEMKKTQSGIDVAHFSIAVDRPGTRKDNKQTDFFDCVQWGGKDGPGRAGVIQQYFHKGDGIDLRGVMQSRKYQDKDGNNRIAWEVIVQDFEFPISKRGDGQGTQPQESAAQSKSDSFTPVANEELPF